MRKLEFSIPTLEKGSPQPAILGTACGNPKNRAQKPSILTLDFHFMPQYAKHRHYTTILLAERYFFPIRRTLTLLEEIQHTETPRKGSEESNSSFDSMDSSQIRIQEAVEILLTKTIPNYFPGFSNLSSKSQELVLMKLAYLVDVYDPSIFRDAEFCNKEKGPCSLRVSQAHKKLARAHHCTPGRIG